MNSFFKLTLITEALLLVAPASFAGDASSAWGTQSGAAGFNSAQSAQMHRSLGDNASQAEMGRSAPPPGTALTTIGSLNTISIDGDGNQLTVTQESSNTGTTTSNFVIGSQ